jgi:hypothetical protein
MRCGAVSEVTIHFRIQSCGKQTEFWYHFDVFDRLQFQQMLQLIPELTETETKDTKSPSAKITKCWKPSLRSRVEPICWGGGLGVTHPVGTTGYYRLLVLKNRWKGCAPILFFQMLRRRRRRRRRQNKHNVSTLDVIVYNCCPFPRSYRTRGTSSDMSSTTSQAESFRPLGLGPGLFAVILIAAVRLRSPTVFCLTLRLFKRAFRFFWLFARLFETRSRPGTRASCPLALPPLSSP